MNSPTTEKNSNVLLSMCGEWNCNWEKGNWNNICLLHFLQSIHLALKFSRRTFRSHTQQLAITVVISSATWDPRFHNIDLFLPFLQQIPNILLDNLVKTEQNANENQKKSLGQKSGIDHLFSPRHAFYSLDSPKPHEVQNLLETEALLSYTNESQKRHLDLLCL